MQQRKEIDEAENRYIPSNDELARNDYLRYPEEITKEARLTIDDINKDDYERERFYQGVTFKDDNQ